MSSYISGSVGYTLLERNNEYILVLADIHDGVKYCYIDSPIMIAKWLQQKSAKSSILLEELLRENYNVSDLWPNAQHTKELKQLNQIDNRIIPVDIRPSLLPFSWEIVDMNKELGKTTLFNYIKQLEDLFNVNSDFYNKYIKEQVHMMEINQSRYKDSKVTPQVHYNEIKHIFNQFKEDTFNLMDKSITYIIKTNVSILERINNIISMLMEWYVILLIFNDVKNIIIHVGLAHSSRLILFLTKVYRYKIIEQSGINTIDDVNTSVPSACIKTSNAINAIYNKKYGFYN